MITAVSVLLILSVIPITLLWVYIEETHGTPDLTWSDPPTPLYNWKEQGL